MTKPMTLIQQDWTRFLTPEGLAEKCGVPSRSFDRMLLKELVDNAMDTGTPVQVKTINSDCVVISDQGDGVDLDAFDIKRPLQSSKHWRTGKRGALGNGLRAVMGALYCLDGCLEVESRGSHTRLTVSLSGDIKREVFGSSDWSGTRLTIHCNGIENAVSFARGATDNPGDTLSTKRPSPHWLDTTAIIDLQRSAEGVTVGDFCKQFHTRFKPSDPEQLVTEVDAKHLLKNMQREAMNDPTVRSLINWRDDEPYVKTTGEFRVGDALLPYVIQVWAEAKPEGSGEITEYAPIINRTNSLTAMGLTIRDKKGRISMHNGGKAWQLSNAERDKLTLRTTIDYEFIVAITAPYVPILSSGKSPDLSGLILPILRSVGKAGRKAHNGLKRKTKGVTIKDAVTALLPAAYANVSDDGEYWANARQLMYEMRPDILRICGIKKFSDKHITQVLLPEFLVNNPELTADWRIAYDKRGSLVEPHTGTTVGLGTVEVAGYTDKRTRIQFDRPVAGVGLLHNTSPEHRFNGLLFIEKEGFTELVTESGILERFDLALASTKGMSVVAARELIDDMAGRNENFVVYTVTDFDITGQSITHTLVNDTERYQFRNEINCVHLGVDWDQAQKLHNEGRSEPVEGDQEHRANLLFQRGLDADAVDFLTGEEPKRVEVNALRPAEFLKMLENGIGFPDKAIPPETVLCDAYRELSIKHRLREIEADLRSEAAPKVPDHITRDVAIVLNDDPALSWDQALLEIIKVRGTRQTLV